MEQKLRFHVKSCENFKAPLTEIWSILKGTNFWSKLGQELIGTLVKIKYYLKEEIKQWKSRQSAR